MVCGCHRDDCAWCRIVHQLVSVMKAHTPKPKCSACNDTGMIVDPYHDWLTRCGLCPDKHKPV